MSDEMTEAVAIAVAETLTARPGEPVTIRDRTVAQAAIAAVRAHDASLRAMKENDDG